MLLSVRESNNLLFNGWTVPGTLTFASIALESRKQMSVFLNYFMCSFICIRYKALNCWMLRSKSLPFMNEVKGLDWIIRTM